MTDPIARLLAYINAEVSQAVEPIDSGTDLLLTGAVDSLGVVQITQWIEDQLGIEIDPTEITLDHFQTVNRMAVFLESKEAAI